MGLLIQTPDDIDIVRRLNRRFRERHLIKLRKYQRDTGDQIFAPGRTLKRIAWRLRLWPVTSPADRPRARWFKFLSELQPTTQEQIREILYNELANAQTRRIYFDYAEDTRERAEAIPAKKGETKLMLYILGPMDRDDDGDPDVPDPDLGEGNGDPGDEPDEIDTGKKKWTRNKTKSKKADGKKKAKKKAKKKSKRR